MHSSAVRDALRDLVRDPRSWAALAAGPAAWLIFAWLLSFPLVTEVGFVDRGSVLAGVFVGIFAVFAVISRDVRLIAILQGLSTRAIAPFHPEGTAPRAFQLNKLMEVAEVERLQLAAQIAAHLYPEIPELEGIADGLEPVVWDAMEARIAAEVGGTPSGVPWISYRSYERKLREHLGDAKFDSVWEQAGAFLAAHPA